MGIIYKEDLDNLSCLFNTFVDSLLFIPKLIWDQSI